MTDCSVAPLLREGGGISSSQGTNMKSFLKPKYVTHEVNGVELRFYPMTLSLVIRLRAVGEPILRMMSHLQERLLSKKNLFGQSFVDTSDAGGFRRIENTLQPITADLFDRQRKEAQETVEQIIKTTFNEDTPLLLAEVCVDSLREEYQDRKPGGRVDEDALQEMFRDLDIGTLAQMLIGVGRANRKALGPFGDKLALMWSESRKPEPPPPTNVEPSSNEPSSSPENIKKNSPENEENAPREESKESLGPKKVV